MEELNQFANRGFACGYQSSGGSECDCNKMRAIQASGARKFLMTMKSILKTDPSKLMYHLISDEHTLGEYNFARLNTRPSGSRSYPPIVFEDQFKDYFKFGFVRNPYDRYVSAYRMCIREAGRSESSGYTEALGWCLRKKNRDLLISGRNKKVKYLASKYKKHTRENFREFFEKTIPYETDPNKISKARRAAAINHHWTTQIHFVPRISIIDCLKGYRAHRLIDAELKTMILPDNNKIELGTTISHFFINKDEFTLFINNN